MLIGNKNLNNWGGNTERSKNIPFSRVPCAYKCLSVGKVSASRLLLAFSKLESIEFHMFGSHTTVFISS